MSFKIDSRKREMNGRHQFVEDGSEPAEVIQTLDLTSLQKELVNRSSKVPLCFWVAGLLN